MARACNSSYREPEVGESLEPGRWRLQWAKMVPLYSSLGNKSETLPQRKEKKKHKNHWIEIKKKKSLNYILTMLMAYKLDLNKAVKKKKQKTSSPSAQ